MTKVCDHVISKEKCLKPTNAVLYNHALVARIDISVFLILPKILFTFYLPSPIWSDVITREMRMNYRIPFLY